MCQTALEAADRAEVRYDCVSNPQDMFLSEESPFLEFLLRKNKLKRTLFVPCPSHLPSLSLLNHEWIVLWLSANRGSPPWDAPWAVLRQAVGQGRLSEVTTWCKSTKTKFLVERVVDEVLRNIWVWNRTDFGGKETSSCEPGPTMNLIRYVMVGIGIKLEKEKEEIIVIWIAMGLLFFMNNGTCSKYHVKQRWRSLCRAPERFMHKVSSCMAMYQPWENWDGAWQPSEAACGAPVPLLTAAAAAWKNTKYNTLLTRLIFHRCYSFPGGC